MTQKPAKKHWLASHTDHRPKAEKMENKTKRREGRKRSGKKQIKPKQSSWSISFFSALVSLILLGGVLWYHQNTTGKKHEQVIRQNNADAKPIVQSKSKATNRRAEMMAVKELVLSHPSKEISQDLDRRIKMGKVILNFQSDQHRGATAAFYMMDIRGYGLSKIMFVNPHMILKKTQTREYIQLVLYHEYQHLLQLERGQIQLQDLARAKPGTLKSPEFVRRWFKMEMQAYTAECQLAQKLGWQKHFDACYVWEKDKRLFKKRIAFAMAARPGTHHLTATLLRELGSKP
ncbi:MAG: hypothetical protein ABIH87_03700 [bacterium]